jgi:outer membrane protein insertion porin family
MNAINKGNSYIFLLSLALLAASCKSTKFLDEDESLLKEVKFDIVNKSEVKDKAAFELELRYFLRQDVNKKFLGIPREYIYYKSIEKKDSSGIDKWVRNTFGEKPSVYNQAETDKTISSIEQYLKYKKGFPNAEVSYDLKSNNKISKITYKINLNSRHYVANIDYFSKDKAVHEELQYIKSQSIIKQNDPLDADLFDREKLRIVNHFQNIGYADFASNYILVLGDSSKVTNKTDVIFEIVPPFNKSNHQRYKVGKIKIYTDYYNKQDTSDMELVSINGKYFFTEQSTFIVDPKIIAQGIAFEEGKYISKEDRLNTYNKLSTLSSYRFVEIENKLNKKDSAVVDIEINLTPQVNKWTSDVGFDAFNSSLTRSSNNVKNLNLLGFGISGQFENKNLLGGSERYLLGAELGTQLELTNKENIFRAFNYNLNNTLSYPVFKDPFKIVGALNKIYLASDETYNSFKNNATTNINLGFNGTSFRDQYRLYSFNSSLGYRFTDKLSRNISLDVIGLTYNDFAVSDSFVSNSTAGQFLRRSFTDNLFSGFLFRSISYTYNGDIGNKKLSYSFLFNAEQSGIEVGLFNKLISPNKTWKIGSLDFSKFLRLEFDGRIKKSYSGDRALVGRFNIGVVSPFVKGQASPYIRQFDVGGPNSLRAWAPRVLGPGENLFKLDSLDIPYARGDFKLEANIEYRFPIWWIMEGAVFADAGNVWALNGYDNIPGARLSSQFYNQIAVAAGWGMRWDFTYFNIRFDFGYRLRDPYPTEGRHWYTRKNIRNQKLGNIQVAVNYPF